MRGLLRRALSGLRVLRHVTCVAVFTAGAGGCLATGQGRAGRPPARRGVRGLRPPRPGLASSPSRRAEVRSPRPWEEPAPAGRVGAGPFRAPAEGRAAWRAGGMAGREPGPGTAWPSPPGGEPAAAAEALISAGGRASESGGSTAPAESTALETERGFFVRCRRFSFIWHQQGSLRGCLTSLCGALCEGITLPH